MSKSLVTYQRNSAGELVAVRPASGAVLCLDTSGSMAECDGGRELRRIDVLATVLVEVLTNVQLTAACTFGYEVTEIPLSGDISVPEPRGTTPMHTAIRWALDHDAKRVVLITDGEPDSRDLAMNEARECGRRGIIIDAYYCGAAGSFCERWLKELVAAAAPGGKAGQFLLTDANAGSNAAQEIILRIGHG